MKTEKHFAISVKGSSTQKDNMPDTSILCTQFWYQHSVRCATSSLNLKSLLQNIIRKFIATKWFANYVTRNFSLQQILPSIWETYTQIAFIIPLSFANSVQDYSRVQKSLSNTRRATKVWIIPVTYARNVSSGTLHWIVTCKPLTTSRGLPSNVLNVERVWRTRTIIRNTCSPTQTQNLIIATFVEKDSSGKTCWRNTTSSVVLSIIPPNNWPTKKQSILTNQKLTTWNKVSFKVSPWNRVQHLVSSKIYVLIKSIYLISLFNI